ncbi:response regulator [Herbaspirillum sp. WKF16]|jgi:two-component system chemotaxis response regulator CheY|uniref:response regulator n=1 Tax=Herbaspirillum sp. WKF16 TaxID=3028312 RepID=UPI0023A9B305|nr:response regulator [Herbaspirillum sp. WKF16]WDZ94113.1 response regulator [Herbaspirillum sp. WKF16]
MNETTRQQASVLVVEDNADAREIFAFTLSNQGYRVIEAGDGAEALLRLEEGPIDVILTDLRMPRIDGITLASTVRKLPHLRNIPIIAITATPLTDKSWMLGLFDEVLLKPCSIQDLVEAITRFAAT